MKKCAFAGSALALMVVSVSAMADNAMNAGTFGLSVDTLNSQLGMIQGKYFMSSNLAVVGGFGLASYGNGGGTTWTIMGGVRNYMSTGDFSPFIEGVASYQSANSGNMTAWALVANGGGEYFFNKHFSVEGKVGLGYASQTVSTTVFIGGIPYTVNTTSTVFGTRTAALGANFYF